MVKHKTKKKRTEIVVGSTLGVFKTLFFLFFIFAWVQMNVPWLRVPRVRVDYDRSADSEAAYTALSIAESTNYTTILNITIFTRPESEDILNPSYGYYAFMMYANNLTLEYYYNRMHHNLNQTHRPMSMTYEYFARAHWFPSVTLNINRSDLRLNGSGTQIEYGLYSRGIAANHTGVNYTIWEPNRVIASFNDVFIVYMDQHYDESWAALAAFWTSVRQVIVLNSLGEILFVFVSRSQALSS